MSEGRERGLLVVDEEIGAIARLIHHSL